MYYQRSLDPFIKLDENNGPFKHKEIPFERHYGRKPRTDSTSYSNFSPNVKSNDISAKPETLQVYTFANKEEHHDQLVMRAPRKLREDVSDTFSYLLFEKKVNKNKFESAYDTKSQVAVAGTKHTNTDKNRTLQRKRASKQLNPTFQNPISRQKKIREDQTVVLQQ